MAGSTAMFPGLKPPPGASEPVTSRMKTPLGSNSSTVSPASATKISPSGPTATLFGFLKEPAGVPVSLFPLM